MEIKEYIRLVIDQLVDCHDEEVPAEHRIDFDIGVTHNGTGRGVIVAEDSPNRIKFAIVIKRS